MGRSCRHYKLGVGIPILCTDIAQRSDASDNACPEINPATGAVILGILPPPRDISIRPARPVVPVGGVEVPTRTDKDSDSGVVAIAMVRPAPPAAVAIAMLDIDLSAGRNRGAEDGRGGQSKEEFPHAMLPSVCLLGVNA